MDPNCPWNVLPVSPNGDADENDLYTSVGYAISRWESLEYGCSLLYSVLLNASNIGAVEVYGMMIAFSGRKELLLAAIGGFRFEHLPGFQRLKPLIREISHFSARRNEIAHGVVTTSSADAVGYYLLPVRYATNKKSEGSFADSKYAYTSAQIRHYGENFFRLDNEVRYWEDEVRESWLVKYEGWPRPVTKWHSPQT